MADTDDTQDTVIYCKGPTRTFSVNVDSLECTVFEFKRKIEIKTHVAPEVQRITCNAMTLHDNNPLSDHISAGDTVQLSYSAGRKADHLRLFVKSVNTPGHSIIPRDHVFEWVFTDDLHVLFTQPTFYMDVVQVYTAKRVRVSGNITYDNISMTLRFTPTQRLWYLNEYFLYLDSTFFEKSCVSLEDSERAQIVSGEGISVTVAPFRLERVFVRERGSSYTKAARVSLSGPEPALNSLKDLLVGYTDCDLALILTNGQIVPLRTNSSVYLLKEDDYITVYPQQRPFR